MGYYSNTNIVIAVALPVVAAVDKDRGKDKSAPDKNTMLRRRSTTIRPGRHVCRDTSGRHASARRRAHENAGYRHANARRDHARVHAALPMRQPKTSRIKRKRKEEEFCARYPPSNGFSLDTAQCNPTAIEDLDLPQFSRHKAKSGITARRPLAPRHRPCAPMPRC